MVKRSLPGAILAAHAMLMVGVSGVSIPDSVDLAAFLNRLESAAVIDPEPLHRFFILRPPSGGEADIWHGPRGRARMMYEMRRIEFRVDPDSSTGRWNSFQPADVTIGRRRGNDIEATLVFMSILRAAGFVVTPMVVLRGDEPGAAESPPAPRVPITRLAAIVLEPAAWPEGEGHGPPQGTLLDPGCAWCGFGYLRMSLQGRWAAWLDGPDLRWRRLPVRDADANGIHHRAGIQLGKTEPVGRPLLPGGFSDPDTTGTIPVGQFSLKEDFQWTGEATRVFRPRTFPRPKEPTPIHLAPLPESEDPAALHDEVLTGFMCLRPNDRGNYRLPNASLKVRCLLPDTSTMATAYSRADSTLQLEFPFVVTDTITADIPAWFEVINQPADTRLIGPGFRCETSGVVRDGRILHSLRLEVRETQFRGRDLATLQELARMLDAWERDRPWILALHRGP